MRVSPDDRDMNDGHDVLGEGRRDFLRASRPNTPGSKSFGQLHEIESAPANW